MEIGAANIFTSQNSSGIYTIEGTADLEDLFGAAKAASWRVFYLNGKRAVSKEDYLDAWAALAEFPNYFGYNWDALYDCLTDLSWYRTQGFLTVLEHSKLFRDADPDAAEVAYGLLEEVASFWKQTGTPFVVLLLN